MNPAEYARMRELEDWYWWFVARRAAAARFVLDYAPLERPLRILDAGCGTGAMMDLFRSWPDTRCYGLDLSPDALRFSRERGQEGLVCGDMTCLPFRSGSFDVVTALDVIEHVPQDDTAVQEVARVLRPGGILVASVPAYQFLWGPHDVALHHQRRYRMEQFHHLIHGSGLRVERETYLLTALFPLAAAVRLSQRGKKGHPEVGAEATLPAVPAALNRALVGLQAAELALARRVPLPFGLTVLTVARKPVPARASLPAAVGDERVATAANW